MSLRVSSLLNKPNILEILLVGLILFGAGWLRFVNLALLPGGFHGDEAVSGMIGQQILGEGWIGPYTPLTLGQPTGPLYLTAISMHFFGSTVWAVRAVSALLGTMTVLVLYLMLRQYQGRGVALVGMAFLATLHWHLHFSRVGFPIIAWPLCTLLATWAALEAARREQARWWGLAGLLLGLGFYVYNAHILCVVALGVWQLFYLARRQEVALSRRVRWFLSFGGAGLLAAVPMLGYALNPANNYFGHAKAVSIFSAPGSKWLELERSGPRIGFLLGRLVDFWDNLSWHSQIDSVDGTGAVPVFPLLLLVVALAGLVLGWKAKRGPLVGMSLCFFLLLPFGPVLTVEGLNRRAFAMAPFLAFLAAIGVVEIYRWGSGMAREARSQKPTGMLRRAVTVGGVALLCGVVVQQNVNDYFERSLPSDPLSWTFGQDLAETCRYFNTIPPDAYVYFYSQRWGRDYEALRFQAPRVRIEDRSKEFGTYSFAVDRAKGRPCFVLLGDYQSRLTELQKLYPGSHIHKGPINTGGRPAFLAVWPDA